MQVYLDLVMLLNFGVDFFLLLGTNRLLGYPSGVLRTFIAAALGGIYAGSCMLPGFIFLGNIFWRLVCLSAMAVIAFGWNRTVLRRGVVFIFLSMALGGAATMLGNGGFGALLAAAAAVAGICFVGLRGHMRGQEYVPVELVRGEKRIQLMALHDTGNTLSDPITGQSVLIAGPDIAKAYLGLTPEQLSDPIRTMERGHIPGLRLIPYRAVGQSSGMLLAVRFDKVKIRGKEAGSLVAFAPNQLGGTEAYQALTGGVI